MTISLFGFVIICILLGIINYSAGSVPTAEPTFSPTPNPTFIPSPNPTLNSTPSPSSQPSGTPSNDPSALPTNQPTRKPFINPTCQPSSRPSTFPLSRPTRQPISNPTVQPSTQPSISPTNLPSSQPSSQPSLQPFSRPSVKPSTQPTRNPSVQPSLQPSRMPTVQPSVCPSNMPSSLPSSMPSNPSSQPTNLPSMQPSSFPTGVPLKAPSTQPTSQPSKQPWSQPSNQPFSQPTRLPSSQPTSNPSGPSSQPTTRPSMRPSTQPMSYPSALPTRQPTSQPSKQPWSRPTKLPSAQPSMMPSSQPTGEPTLYPTIYSVIPVVVGVTQVVENIIGGYKEFKNNELAQEYFKETIVGVLNGVTSNSIDIVSINAASSKRRFLRENEIVLNEVQLLSTTLGDVKVFYEIKASDIQQQFGFSDPEKVTQSISLDLTNAIKSGKFTASLQSQKSIFKFAIATSLPVVKEVTQSDDDDSFLDKIPKLTTFQAGMVAFGVLLFAAVSGVAVFFIHRNYKQKILKSPNKPVEMNELRNKLDAVARSKRSNSLNSGQNPSNPFTSMQPKSGTLVAQNKSSSKNNNNSSSKFDGKLNSSGKLEMQDTRSRSSSVSSNRSAKSDTDKLTSDRYKQISSNSLKDDSPRRPSGMKNNSTNNRSSGSDSGRGGFKADSPLPSSPSNRGPQLKKDALRSPPPSGAAMPSRSGKSRGPGDVSTKYLFNKSSDVHYASLYPSHESHL